MLNVQTAFLSADVEKKVYVKMAPSYETYDNSGVSFVMKLKKSLYGLRQSPKNWFGTMNDYISNIVFRSLKSDPCVYVFEDKTGTATLTLYVDDILLFGNNKHFLGKLKKQLMDCFEMTDLGDVSKVLGINVTRDRENGTITIDQKDYTEDVLVRYLQRRVYAGRRTRHLPRPASRQAAGLTKKTAVPVHRRRANVPRAGLAVRHPLRGQSAGKGNVQALGSLHGGGQIRTPVLGRVREFPYHLQARWL